MKNYWITKARSRSYFRAVENHLRCNYSKDDLIGGLSTKQVNSLLDEMRHLFQVHFDEPCKIGARNLLKAYEKLRQHILRS